ncbi:MAG: histidine--tRNA ligase [Prevotella sp.]|nr:histidine--tRNA ligase [Prevotella sp.]
MKPSIPKGTRDFSPKEMARRNYIFSTIRDVFSKYGFQQIETPAQETLQTLLGKYGEEGDKLLFRILNSGDYLAKTSQEDLNERNSLRLSNQICEKGLRYDLTVPFARYVVMHREEIQIPFKRYQIQPVWRADRPQKGRYREFYQCDADIVGSDSLLNEIELIQIADDVFSRLKLNVAIKLNNRKILTGIVEYIGEAEHIVDITVAIDKLDKIGIDNVNQELQDRGLSTSSIEKLQPILGLTGDTDAKLDILSHILQDSEIGMLGISEMRYIFSMVKKLNLVNRIELDLTLARGLNYYTGTIIEIKSLDYSIGSISGGGRYDNLTGIFGMPGLSGVGISFGADRIYDALDGLGLYPENLNVTTKVIFLNFGENEINHIMPLAWQLRKNGVATEIYPESTKIKKQMSYANTKGIPFVAIIGENEVNENKVTLKNMLDGTQSLLSTTEFLNFFQK